MEIWEERFKRVNEKIEIDTTRLNNHAERIDDLEKFQSSTQIEIRNLIEQIKSLVSVMRWGITSTIMLLLGFFLWYVQQL